MIEVLPRYVGKADGLDPIEHVLSSDLGVAAAAAGEDFPTNCELPLAEAVRLGKGGERELLSLSGAEWAVITGVPTSIIHARGRNERRRRVAGTAWWSLTWSNGAYATVHGEPPRGRRRRRRRGSAGMSGYDREPVWGV